MSSASSGAIEGPPTSSDSAAIAAGSGAPTSGDLVVDVSGAVAQPGLYHLPRGSRVGDAVDAAGGFGPRVDVARVGQEVHLAATLTDGQQIRVPSRDDPASRPGGSGTGNTAETGGGGGGGGSGGTGGGGGAGTLVNLNTATQAELEALPGIGPVTATKIIAARGDKPFASVDELRDRGLVGEKTFGQLKALVTVG
jgi:competence protein ComEA